MRKMILSGLLSLAVLMGMQSVSATDWVDVASSNDSSWSIDLDSIRKDEYGVSLWIKVNMNDNSKSLLFAHIDPSNRTYALTSGIWYDQDGNVIGSYNNPPYVIEWTPIAPDTVIDLIYNIIFSNPFEVSSL